MQKKLWPQPPDLPLATLTGLQDPKNMLLMSCEK